MVKCEICGKRISETFLRKLIGTYVKDKGKKKAVCFGCQKKFKTKQEILKNLK
jgi:hypothetical protein